MRRKKKNKSSDATPRKSSSLRDPRVKRTALLTVLLLGFLGLIAAGFFGIRKLDAHVDRLLLLERPDPVVEFIDLPKELYGLANYDLQRSLFDVLGRDWVEDALCSEIAARVAAVGWVGKVHYARRTGGGRFEVSCRYRMPVAMAMHRDVGYLIDGDGVRLPGTYVQHPAWRNIIGAAQSPPPPGSRWDGDDIQAGLAILAAIQAEPFSMQITGVAVDNFAGRRDPRSCHLELLTDRPGGRIRWGSAPGQELEENGVSQKLALLRQNFASTGRADARYDLIDVSVFPDRFTIPGEASNVHASQH